MVQLDDLRIAIGDAQFLGTTIETRATLRAEAMLAGNTG